LPCKIKNKQNMYRTIQKYLIEWKNETGRKSLLLRGARQVGKTFSVRELGKTFQYYVEVNFESEPELIQLFDGALKPQIICNKLSVYFNTPIENGRTLLFFDEIQNCPNALKALRYFYEQKPELHVVGAGSLLEFSLAEIPSFGVGRISSLFMYPLSFAEFVRAIEGEGLYSLLKKSNPTQPIENLFHNKLFDLLRNYLLIGGMPAVVNKYIETKDLLRCQLLINDLSNSIQEDFAKYQQKISPNILREVYLSVFQQAGRKFKYSNISTDYKVYHYKNALEYILKAGLAYPVFHTAASGIPLGAQIDTQKFKIIPFDIGICQRIMGLELNDLLLGDAMVLINKGAIAEVLTGLEIISNSPAQAKPELYYWHREAKSSNAEVDYIIQRNGKIIPVEVKSGKSGQMQSMNLFINEHYSEKGIRISHENFGHLKNIEIYPLYAVGNI